MRISSILKTFGAAAALCGSLAACGNSDHSRRTLPPPSASGPLPESGAMLTGAARIELERNRIAWNDKQDVLTKVSYRNGGLLLSRDRVKKLREQGIRVCNIDDRFDNSGLIAIRIADQMKLAVGTKWDDSRAAKMGHIKADVGVKFTFNFGGPNHKDQCLGKHRWLGMIPTGLRVAPDAIREYRNYIPGVTPHVADPLLKGLKGIGYE